MTSISSSVRIRARASTRRGFSLLELMVVMTVLTMAIGMFCGTLVSTARQAQMKRELAVAAEGARRVMEWMRSQPCTVLFATYNENPADDPGGAGTAPGQNFLVTGLQARDGDRDGCPGRIVFPTVESALREDSDDESLGMPRDLDGDKLVDSANHAADYVVLPVRVRVEWKGATGDMTLDLYNEFVKQ